MIDTHLKEQVREIMANTFGVDENELPDDLSQENYSRWTSLYQMTIMASLEDHFNLIFSMDEMLAMTNLPKILDVLKKRGV